MINFINIMIRAYMHLSEQELAINVAIEKLQKKFPFPNYFSVGMDAHKSLADKVMQFAKAGARVLDIGCGPVDKTALLSYLGFNCIGIDDFKDPWHCKGENFEKIRDFASDAGVELMRGDGKSLPFDSGSFDVVILSDIIEHFHVSPRELLTQALELLSKGGILIITVPNAANLRKRFNVLRGKSNYPPYDQFFFNEGEWRGHVREYVWDDLLKLGRYMGLTDLNIFGCHHMLSVLPRWFRPIYCLLMMPLPSARDSLMLVARKPVDWQLPSDSINSLANYID